MRAIPLRYWAFSLMSAILQLVPFPLAGPVPLWRRAFCWFCLTPLLLALLGRDRSGNALRPGQAAGLGYLCGVVWYTANCYWIYQTMYLYGGIPKLASVGILLLFALYLGLYHALFAWLVVKVRSAYSVAWALWSVPFLWVAVELARARVTGFPWDLLGYTQVDNFVLTTLVPFGGVMILSFGVAAIGALIAAALLSPSSRRRLVLCAVAAIVALGLQAGSLYRPALDPAKQTAVLLQENLSVGSAARMAPPLTEIEKFQIFEELSRNPNISAVDSATAQAALGGTKHDLIVWPEAPADFNTADPMFSSELSRLAQSTDTPVIAGNLGVDFDRVVAGK